MKLVITKSTHILFGENPPRASGCALAGIQFVFFQNITGSWTYTEPKKKPWRLEGSIHTHIWFKYILKSTVFLIIKKNRNIKLKQTAIDK